MKLRIALKSIKKIGFDKTKTTIKKIGSNNIQLKSQVARVKINKVAKSKVVITDKQAVAIIKTNIRNYDKGLTVTNALDYSLEVDKHRARTQLKVFTIRAVRKDVFTFTVKPSGIHPAPIAYQVDILWDNARNLALGTKKTTDDIFKKSTIKTQCNCGRFTFWYRYLATLGGWVLGKGERRFPVVRNQRLEGVLCKHQIRVLQSIKNPSFAKIFSRYIENIKINKRTRVNPKDTISILTASGRSKKV